jgi:hypothetical protein
MFDLLRYSMHSLGRFLLVAAMLGAACDSSSSGDCTYKGKKVSVGESVVDGCVMCSCGVPGSKSQGLTCLPIVGCDGGTD